MENKNYPDPCDYCPLMYLASKKYNCRKDCEELKEAMKQWSQECALKKYTKKLIEQNQPDDIVDQIDVF